MKVCPPPGGPGRSIVSDRRMAGFRSRTEKGLSEHEVKAVCRCARTSGPAGHRTAIRPRRFNLEPRAAIEHRALGPDRLRIAHVYKCGLYAFHIGFQGFRGIVAANKDQCEHRQ
jgi:hypothetical protein